MQKLPRTYQPRHEFIKPPAPTAQPPVKSLDEYKQLLAAVQAELPQMEAQSRWLCRQR